MSESIAQKRWVHVSARWIQNPALQQFNSKTDAVVQFLGAETHFAAEDQQSYNSNVDSAVHTMRVNESRSMSLSALSLERGLLL